MSILDPVRETKPLFLVGMMGAGKSTVGAALARRLGLDFVDSDEEIECAAGKPIAQIFQADGEAAFRKIESRVVLELAAGAPLVAALGGGAISRPGMAEKLAHSATVVYLRASPEQLLDRVGDGAKRPLLTGLDRESRLARLRAFAEERESSYLTARVVIDTDGATIPEVVCDIVERLSQIDDPESEGGKG